MQVVEFLKANTKLSALYYATVAVMSDVLRFLVVLGLLGAGLSVAMYWLIVAHNIHDGQAYEDAADTGIVTGGSLKDFVFYVFLSFLGITSLEEPVLSSWLIRILFASSVLISVVVVLNLLVSTMVSTYDLMQRSCNELAVKSLAELVVRSEEALTSERRKAIFASLNLDSPLEFEKVSPLYVPLRAVGCKCADGGCAGKQDIL